jgi:hypothetical protein
MRKQFDRLVAGPFSPYPLVAGHWPLLPSPLRTASSRWICSFRWRRGESRLTLSTVVRSVLDGDDSRTVCVHARPPVRDDKAYTDNCMRRLASVFAIFILLVTAAPLLACMTDSVMSQEESACCRAMHGKCDGMEKMGCCRTEVRGSQHPQLAASAPRIDLHLAVVDWVEPFVSEVQYVPRCILGIADAHSPPGLVIARITVLRI